MIFIRAVLTSTLSLGNSKHEISIDMVSSLFSCPVSRSVVSISILRYYLVNFSAINSVTFSGTIPLS